MTTKQEKLELLDKYYSKIAPLKAQAEKAYGSRATSSANHVVSRAYTNALKEYAENKGSLILLAQALDVTYAALRRRVMTASLPALPERGRSKATAKQYAFATNTLRGLRESKDSTKYHEAIYEFYSQGLSVTRMSRELGLKSAYPLYYGLTQERLRRGESA